jgi:hypothetical protein
MLAVAVGVAVMRMSLPAALLGRGAVNPLSGQPTPSVRQGFPNPWAA